MVHLIWNLSSKNKISFNKKIEFYSVTEFGLNPLQFGNKCGTLTVNVLPVNEFTPVFKPITQQVILPENAPQSKFSYFFNNWAAYSKPNN